MSSVENELHALRYFLAAEPIAVYVPALGRPLFCPNMWGHPGRCDREFNLPRAQDFAARLQAAGTEAHVLVYGIPWVCRGN